MGLYFYIVFNFIYFIQCGTLTHLTIPNNLSSNVSLLFFVFFSFHMDIFPFKCMSDSFFVIIMRSVILVILFIMVIQSVTPNNQLLYHC